MRLYDVNQGLVLRGLRWLATNSDMPPPTPSE